MDIRSRQTLPSAALCGGLSNLSAVDPKQSGEAFGNASIYPQRGAFLLSILKWLRHGAVSVGLPGALTALFSVVLIGVMWTVALERAQYEYQDAIADAASRSSLLTRVLEERTVNSLKNAEHVFALVAGEYGEHGTAGIEKIIEESRVDADMFNAIGILDRRGHIMFSDPRSAAADMSDRDFYRALRDKPDIRMFVGKPVVGRLTGKWVIPVARSIFNRDGSFVGVVFGGIGPEYFTSFYRSAELGEYGLVTLVGLDGISRVRRMHDSDSYGHDMRDSSLIVHQAQAPTGSFVGKGKIEGIPRYFSYRTLRDYGLIMAVGLSVEEVTAPFRQKGRIYEYTAAGGTLFIVLFAGVIMTLLWRRRRTLDEIAFKNTILSTQQEVSLDAILLVDENTRIVSYNSRFIEMWGISGKMVREGNDEQLLAFAVAQMQDAEAFLAKVRHLYAHKDEKSHDELHTNDGRTIDRYSAPVVGANGNYYGRVWCFRDVTERKRREEESRLSAKAFERIADGMIVTDAQQIIVSVNKGFCDITGYQPEEIVGRTPRFFQSGRHDAAFYSEMWREISQNGYWRGEIWDRRRNGEVYPELLSISAVKDASGTITHYVGVCTDISSLKQYEAQLHHQAHHDALTGLPNRILFRERFGETLGRARRHGYQAAVLFLDLDHFKSINDSLGHDVGDLLLQAVAKRLTTSIREVDTVARFGGDEFAVLLDTVEDDQSAATVARKLLDAVGVPFQLAGHEFFVSVSVGISCFPQDGNDIETLFKNADTAMYRAKTEGRNNYQFFSADMNAKALENLMMSQNLRLALERNELSLNYQPCLDLKSGRVSSAEALIRWNHPQLGLIPPGRFIPLAEETGLIEPIGEWVLRSACRQMRQWMDAGLPLRRVAVNLSARQFHNPNLLQLITGILAETRVSADHLELEVTESMMMQNPEYVADVLSQLKAIGVTIAVDDFGTGYSSLSYLKRFPIDFLKIDRSFVSGVPGHADDVAIIRAIIALAKSLNLKVIAEGVETVEQRGFLSEQGCDELQGYLFSKPVAASEIPALLGFTSNRFALRAVASA